MELNNGYIQKSDDEDRLSMLTDDVLLSILERVDITTATRTSVLSTRWKHLPWLFRELTIDVREFLSVPPPNPIEVGHMDEAMASLTKAATSFWATTRAKPPSQGCSSSSIWSTLTRMSLALYCSISPSATVMQGALALEDTSTGFKLSLLELDFCCLGKLEVLCLPKLEKLRWDIWMFPLTPLSFGVAPFLKELNVICGASVHHQGFDLSKVLRIQQLYITLNFRGEKLWIKPEGKLLCAAFKKLRKLSLHGIFVEFDLLWMMVLLEGAPSVEIFDIEIWEHPCVVDTEGRRKTYGERTNPSWNIAEFKSCKEWLLKEVQVTGFSPMEQQLALLRAVMQRASNLQTIVLKHYQPCDYCDEIGALPRCERLPPERVFPKGKGGAGRCS
ncbi:unnamed protein product [Miscanthus lutarioriparius]|uniref:F-box domain-containing protein n=1 Tax=Miscanthus lutarioriparius TaxID=422564 RepID=A0A811NFF5_9POAL|nr:unnamed protein product [Miscanthus lutarioriparius]